MARTAPHALRLVAGSCAGLLGSAALAQEGCLILPDAPGGTFTVAQSDEDTESLLQVFVGPMDACCDGRSPLSGRYTGDGETLVFAPAFDLESGQVYTLQTAGALSEFSLPPNSDAVTPEVLAIYPSGPGIPENTLRFYLHFSPPMQPHVSTDYIQILDAQGTVDPTAFMTFTQELWSEDRTHLTLLMDPGCIKRGVATNLELGPALLEGQRYSLAVVEGWPGAMGQQQASGFAHQFTVSAPLRELPNTDLWQIIEPAPDTTDALAITFDRPFDHQLAHSHIRVAGADGQTLPGTITLEDHERTWRFTPHTPWPEEGLQIVVDARLEDVAGNYFRDLLDHAVGMDVRAIDQIILPLRLRP